MPFDRTGIWTQPVEKDHADFHKQLLSTKQEITPTPEMIQAIAANLPKTDEPVRADVFNTIGKLKGAVDIVIPIYDGLHVLKPCLESVFKHTQWNYNLILVDDCSPDPAIKDFIDNFTPPTDSNCVGQVSLRNKTNRGFAPTVNRGVSAGRNPYICILNSDTLVTEGWLVRQLMALEADERNVIVNPATNNTALVDVPMYAGCSYVDMADALAVSTSNLTYNEIMPTGFCFTLRRELWQNVGPFDESYESYGEELICIDQPVLTTNGWSTVKDLTTEDVVFSEAGEQVKVLGATPVQSDRRCYEITFDTGEKIVTDHSHRWRVSTNALIQAKSLRGEKDSVRSESYNQRIKAKALYDKGTHYKDVATELGVSIRTAQEYLARYRKGIIDKHFGQRELTLSTEDMFLKGIFCASPHKTNCYNFKLPVAPPLNLDEKPLLIDPYCLGVWLGDGTSKNSGMTFIDLEILEFFKSVGYDVTSYDRKTHRVKQPFTAQLRELDLLGNKHVPTDYLFGSYDQRLALLQGLMDTDGHCTAEGKCSFDNTNMELINAAAFLIRSLGMKAHLPQPTRKSGYPDCHRVVFRAMKSTPVFRLQRKLNNQVTAVRNRVKHHAIIDIQPVKPVPVRCISVDSPNRLFLVGNSLVPTHNTDLWFKAIKQTDEEGIILRNRGVIADNAYVFHERGTSFSQLDAGKHMGLRRSGSARFNDLHPDFRSWQGGFDSDGSVHDLRYNLPQAAFKKKYKGNLAWVVKSAGPCGGMNFIADIVNQLIEDGYNAKVCIVPDNYDEENPPTLPVIGNLRTAPILFKSHEEFTSTFTQRVFSTGKVFAAVTELTPIVWDLDQTYKGIKGINHVQSYDVALAEIAGRPELVPGFMESYNRLPNIVSSKWITEVLQEQGCTVQGNLLPGVNVDLFHPRNRQLGDERFTVAILIDDSYPFKGADWAREFIKELAPENNSELRVLGIGPKAVDLQGVTCLGNLSQAKMASLLGTEVDILVDPAVIHSYGMPGLEALASGCHVITRENKGIHEYGHNWPDKCLIEDKAEDAANLVFELMEDVDTFSHGEISPVPPGVERSTCVKEFVNFITYQVCDARHRIEIITPHLRKHGGPATIISVAQQLKALNHNVSMSTVYTDWNPMVLNAAAGINIRTAWEDVPESVEAVFINSDNPYAKHIMEKNPGKKYIMLKLSHNPRFKKTENDNLNLPWDHIVTSTDWLREVCLSPQEGWTHRSWDPNDVTVTGWYHYGHKQFNMPPSNRVYGSAEAGFSVGTLIHDHPLKGSEEALASINGLKKKYEAQVHAVGFGEVKFRKPWYMQYFRSAGREEMANAFKQLDIWLGASHSEGLGRLALEAMSAGVAVVTTDTGAEFMKDGENCLLYEPKDPQRGAELVDQLATNRELFQKIVLNGHATAAAAANPATMKQNLNAVLKKVLE